MAIQNLTRVTNTGNPFGDKHVGVVEIEFDLDGAAPTGGYTLFQTTVRTISGLEGITILDIPDKLVCSSGSVWRTLHYNKATNRLQVFNGSTEVTGDLSTFVNIRLAVYFI